MSCSCFVPTVTKAANDDNEIDQLLLITDELKTSDKNKFTTQLNQLTSSVPKATPAQQEFIQYLQIYKHVLTGDFDKAQSEYELQFEKTNDIKVKIRIKATLANLQAVSRQYDKALNNLDYVIKAAESIDDKGLKNKINLIASVVYFSLEIFELSQKYADLIINDNPKEAMKCKALTLKYRATLELDNALEQEQMHEAIDLCKSHGQYNYASLLKLDWLHSELEKAHVANDKKLIQILLKLIQSAEPDIVEFGYNNLIGLKDMVLAKAYYYSGQVDLALSSANKAIDGSTNSGNTSQVVDALKILQKDAINQQDYEQAYQFSNRINLIEREIFSEEKSKQMAYMFVMHNNLTKQVEIQQLKQNNEMLELQNLLAAETSKKQNLLTLLVAVILSLLTIWTFRIKRQHDYFKDVAEIDHLTQVFTRKAFEERMKKLLLKSESQHDTVNIAIMDLDHFKLVNDAHGHLVGDWVLKHVILTCEEVVDQDIMIARMGGEEFCMVSPGITAAQMMELTENMRQAIEQMDCSETGANIHITASFGVSNSMVSGYDYSQLLTHADLALFAAKNKGRNKVIDYASIMNA